MSQDRKQAVANAVAHFQRGLAELARLELHDSKDADQLVGLLAKFVDDWRAARSN